VQAGALKLSPAALRECEGVGARFAGTAVAIFDGHAAAADGGELRRSLLLKSVELHFETARNTAAMVESALELGAGSAPSALLTQQAVLGSIDSVNKAVALLGAAGGKGAAANLDDHHTVIAFVSRVLGLAQAVTNSGGLADGEPPAAGMIGLLARIQAGIWSWHQAKADARSTRCPRPPEAVKRP
jgi:hypothetical protein